MKNKHILITGGAGFIGTHLATRLCKDNKVRILDTFHRNAISNTELMEHDNVEVYAGSVLDRDILRMALKGITHIIHMAAIAGVDAVLRQPSYTMEVALIGTYNVLSEALRLNVERIIDFSTSEVFGAYAYKAAEVDVTSLGAVGGARWTYAVSKLATEHLAYTYYREHGLKTCSVRPFNVFGPNQVGQGAIHEFIVRALKNEDILLHNGGNQIRSWCYVDDVIDGIMLVLEKDEAIGETFNLGSPKNTVTTHSLAKEIVRLVGSSSALVSVDKEEQDIELRIPSVEKARKVLGYEPQFDLEMGLVKTIQWYRNESLAFKD